VGRLAQSQDLRYADVILMLQKAAIKGRWGYSRGHAGKIRARQGRAAYCHIFPSPASRRCVRPSKTSDVEFAMEVIASIDLVRWGDAISVLADWVYQPLPVLSDTAAGYQPLRGVLYKTLNVKQ